MNKVIVVCYAVCCLSCSSGGVALSSDLQVDGAKNVVRPDTSSDKSQPDTSGPDFLLDADLPDDGSAPEVSPDVSVLDTSTSDGPLPPDTGGVNPGPVQCRQDIDCGGSLTCNRDAPGGICLGCGTCPGLLVCKFGACARECVTDDDCNVGFWCTSGLLCALRSCDATTPCPAPYSCGANNKCARPSCAGGGSCPPPLSCDGTLCVEP